MRIQTLNQLLSRLHSRGDAAFPVTSRWLVREPSPWQPPAVDVRATMPILPSMSLMAAAESLVIELAPTATPAPISLGRADANDVVINDGTLSKHHLQFLPDDSTWTVADLDSYNGTFLDGVRLTPTRPHTLHDSALLRAGNLELTFHDTAGLLSRLRTTEGRPRGTSASVPR